MTEWRTIANAANLVGEGPLWSDREQSIYWVDILGQTLHRVRWGRTTFETWSMPEMIGFVAKGPGDGLIVGLQSGVAAVSLDPLVIAPLVPLPPDETGNRINDATVDPAGRLWFGTMRPDGATADGSLYRLSGSLDRSRQDGAYFIPNGPAFNRDGSIFYHADSAKRRIYRFAVVGGDLHDRQTFIAFDDPAWGLPDGMTVDADDHLWVAHWDGARLSRFDPAGRLERSIRMPVSRVTSCAFGGPRLDRLIVTSARHERADEPLAGALFEVDVDAIGLPQRPFGA